MLKCSQFLPSVETLKLEMEGKNQIFIKYSFVSSSVLMECWAGQLFITSRALSGILFSARYCFTDGVATLLSLTSTIIMAAYFCARYLSETP